MAKRKPEPEPERRGHPELKYNKNLAETFGITPGADPPRELVAVSHIPTPIDIEDSTPRDPSEGTADDMILEMVREEIEELGARLRKFGIKFSPEQQQAVVDYTMSVLAGFGGGGSIARRQ